MQNPIWRWLFPQNTGLDDEINRRIRLLDAANALILVAVILTLLGSLLGGRTPLASEICEVFIIANFFVIQWLRRKNRLTLAGVLLICVGIVGLTMILISLGTIRAPAAAFFGLFVIFGGLMFNGRGILLTAIISSLTVAGLILAEKAGLLPSPDLTLTVTQWVTYSAFFGIVGGLMYYAQRVYEQMLARTKRELGEREHAEAEMRKLLQAVEQSPASIVITDLNGKIEYVNPRFTQVTGYSVSEAIGKNPRILRTDQTPRATHVELWNTIRAGKEWRGEFVNRKKDGTIYYESAVISPILDANASATHYLAVKEDITRRKEEEALLQASEARFRSLFDLTRDAAFLLDLKGCFLAVNQQTQVMFGYDEQELLALKFVDISAEPEQTTESIARLAKGENLALFEQNYRKKDGQTVPCEVNTQLVRDKNGAPSHFQVMVRDISDRKRAEEAQRQSEAKYRIVADNTYDWEYWQDPNGNYIYISPACVKTCGYEAAELMANPSLPGQLVYPEDRPILDRHNALIKNRVHDEIVFRLRNKDGSLQWIGHTCTPILGENGEYLGVRGSNRNITRRKLAEDALIKANEELNQHVLEVERLQGELREQALRDPLTGLNNRRYLDESLPHIIQWAERERQPVSIIIADIDFFKQINDTHGHLIGDRFLIEIAKTIKDCARGMDVICRFGGEEFLLAMPGASLATATRRAEQIRQRCAQTVIVHEGREIRTTVSFGLANYPEHGIESDQIIVKADMALYDSKKNGRDRVTVWNDQSDYKSPFS